MIISMIITAFGKVSSKLDFALSYCNNLQAQLSTFPFSKGFAALLMLLFLRPWRFYLAEWVMDVYTGDNVRVYNLYEETNIFCKRTCIVL
jgi:hypothetical protein